MSVKIKGLFLAVVFTISLLAGCQQEDNVRLHINSGTENEEYRGEEKYILEKNIKISDEEKENGIQKFEIEHDVILEEIELKQKEEESDGDGGTKPHV